MLLGCDDILIRIQEGPPKKENLKYFLFSKDLSGSWKLESPLGKPNLT
jgi:hypothetical protein